MDKHTHTHTHTCLTALFPRLPAWAGTRKVKPTWILLKQETVSGSGISCATCKSAPRSRQTTTPPPHHSSVLQAGWPSCRPTNSIKELKAHSTEGTSTEGTVWWQHKQWQKRRSVAKLTFRRSVAQCPGSAVAHAAEGRSVSTDTPESASASSQSHSTDESRVASWTAWRAISHSAVTQTNTAHQ